MMKIVSIIAGLLDIFKVFSSWFAKNLEDEKLAKAEAQGIDKNVAASLKEADANELMAKKAIIEMENAEMQTTQGKDKWQRD